MDVTPYLELCPLPQQFYVRLEERKDRVRFVAETEITYATLGRVARALAALLLDGGLPREGRVAVWGENSWPWAAAALAVQAAGGTLVPIYPATTPKQAAFIFEHSDATVLFVDSPERFAELRPHLNALPPGGVFALSERDGHEVVSWNAAVTKGESHDRGGRFENRLNGIHLDHRAVLFYTSGTTGPPKGVPLTYAHLGHNGRDWLEVLAPVLRPDAVDLLWLPMSHMFGFGETCTGHLLGWTSHLSTPKDVLAQMPVVRPHVFMSVPAYWEKLAQHALESSDRDTRRRRLNEATGGRLSFCLSGGAGLDQRIKRLFWESDIPIIEGYGLTETSPTLTMNPPDAPRFDTVGRPFPSVELRLAEDGEILAKGPNVFAGYHKAPKATEAAFTPEGWFRTGDLGRFTDDGYLQIIGRKKEILVTAGGKNVSPANIELLFRDDPLISNLIVFGDQKRYLVAGVWLDHEHPEAQPDRREAAVRARIDAANAQLARFEQIKKFAILEPDLSVENGLLTPTLKVKRKLVYATFAREFEELYA